MVEYTNIISENQIVEQFIPFIGRDNIIGNPFDYNKDTRIDINRKVMDAIFDMNTYQDRKCLYFSFIVRDIKSCKFNGVADAMSQHKLANAIYKTLKEFGSVVELEFNRFYYTRLLKVKTGQIDDLFPIDTNSNEPSARVARGEYGNMMSYKRIELVRELDKKEGWKFDKESDWTYALHIDFKVFFDFSKMKLLSAYLKRKPNFAGAFLTLLVWGVKNQYNHKSAWEKSEKWLIDYADYQCANNMSWYDYDEVNEDPIKLYWPKTFEWWKGIFLPKLEKEGYVFYNNKLIQVIENVDDVYISEQNDIENNTKNDNINNNYDKNNYDKKTKYIINWSHFKLSNNKITSHNNINTNIDNNSKENESINTDLPP